MQRLKHLTSKLSFLNESPESTLKTQKLVFLICTFIGIGSFFVVIHFSVQSIRKFLSSTRRFSRLATLSSKVQFISPKIFYKIGKCLSEHEKFLWIGRPESIEVFSGARLIFIVYSLLFFSVIIVTIFMLYNKMTPFFGPTLIVLSITLGRAVVKLTRIPYDFIYILTDQQIITYSSPEVHGFIISKPRLINWKYQDLKMIKKKQYKDEGISMIFQIVKHPTVIFFKHSYFGFLYILEKSRPKILNILKKRAKQFQKRRKGKRKNESNNK
ncbi:hypothetical protein M0813_05424 [Anaeramoeba flamelloides]|uniref:Uncharacterized protein n=1 Tax=Anaeramoeba flamelloides TaxID=1746091 RepID=A0ABQ8XII9_9EUKA|nr:hypothetical protein M0813_05424 [Anaeramoeba flamelloides]